MMRGFVLLVMLVYLQIFSLLAMNAMAVVAMHKKELFQGYDLIRDRLRAQELLLGLSHQQVNGCQVAMHTTDEIDRADLNWWRRTGCHGIKDSREYFYFREDLGVDACGAIEYEDKQLVAARYYRDTLLYLSKLSYYQSVVAQSTFVVPEHVPLECKESIKRLHPGRQMLRWLW